MSTLKWPFISFILSACTVFGCCTVTGTLLYHKSPKEVLSLQFKKVNATLKNTMLILVCIFAIGVCNVKYLNIVYK